jgi:DNA polymerase-3 subunit epsilon
MRQIVLDTETTGLSPANGDRLIEIACVELIDRQPTGNHLHYYINPERDSHEEALAVHGLTNEFLRDKPRFAEVAPAILEFVVGAEIIIHNAPFDLGFLDAELARLGEHNFSAHARGVIDTLAMARQSYPGQRNSLDALCKRLNVDNSARTLHGALLDAELLAEVYLKLTSDPQALPTSLRQVAVDIRIAETLSAPEGRIVEICCWELIDDRLTECGLHFYVNPASELTEDEAKRHGISNDFLHRQPIFAEVAPALARFIKGAEIIHLDPFALELLDRELQQWGCPALGDWVGGVNETLLEAGQALREVLLDTKPELWGSKGDDASVRFHLTMFLKAGTPDGRTGASVLYAEELAHAYINAQRTQGAADHRRQIVLEIGTTSDEKDGNLIHTDDDRIFNIGCVELVGGKLTGHIRRFFLNPERDYGSGLGLAVGNGFLRDKPTFANAAPAFLAFISGAEILCVKKSDQSERRPEFFLDKELLQLGLPALRTFASGVTVIDTADIAEELPPANGSDIPHGAAYPGTHDSDMFTKDALFRAEQLANLYLGLINDEDEPPTEPDSAAH